jgi:hypothetical protein
MFTSNSRYAHTPVYRIAIGSREVSVVQFPIRRTPPLLGFHRREEGQRLDLIASFYLKDATMFWRVCDGNRAASPHALSTHALIGIPRQER